MTATIIDGKAVAERVRAEVAERVVEFVQAFGRPPGLATVLVGDDPASKIYVTGKDTASKAVGIASQQYHLPSSATEAELLSLVDRLGADDTVDAILVQLPLPPQIDPDRVIVAIPPEKDVDGFHPFNVGLLVAGRTTMPQCTPLGILRLLDEYSVPLVGARVLIANRSNLVGKPLAFMLMQRNATVTIAHRHTPPAALADAARHSDVIVSATGVPGLITVDMVKPGATVIDVAVVRTPDGVVGDVDFAAVREVAGLISPVPGGVGPMTITMLLENTLNAAWRRQGISHVNPHLGFATD